MTIAGFAAEEVHEKLKFAVEFFVLAVALLLTPLEVALPFFMPSPSARHRFEPLLVVFDHPGMLFPHSIADGKHCLETFFSLVEPAVTLIELALHDLEIALGVLLEFFHPALVLFESAIVLSEAIFHCLDCSAGKRDLSS